VKPVINVVQLQKPLECYYCCGYSMIESVIINCSSAWRISNTPSVKKKKKGCVLPGNATHNLWILDLAIRFSGYSLGETTINYNTLNFTVTTTMIELKRFL
jgi:hypothetical protein